jgi:hypothetical protein
MLGLSAQISERSKSEIVKFMFAVSAPINSQRFQRASWRPHVWPLLKASKSLKRLAHVCSFLWLLRRPKILPLTSYVWPFLPKF